MQLPLRVPDALAANQDRFNGAAGRAWVAALPALAAELLDRWTLTPDGAGMHGMVSVVLPVRTCDAVPAVLKLRFLDEETEHEPLALRHWDGDGAVRLLDDDQAAGAMLLERLDAGRPLSALPDEDAAVRVLGTLLARLTARPAPPGLRRLGDIAADLLDAVPRALRALPDADERALLRRLADATAEVLPEPGDRLLHWDLHYDNVLAAAREPWLAIDPKPLAGDPGFDLLPALHNRWADIAASGAPHRAVLRRFDLLTELLGLDRDRAAAWTLTRVLQNCVWDTADGGTRLHPVQTACARALLSR